jgi:hypothetical protein
LSISEVENTPIAQIRIIAEHNNSAIEFEKISTSQSNLSEINSDKSIMVPFSTDELSDKSIPISCFKQPVYQIRTLLINKETYRTGNKSKDRELPTILVQKKWSVADESLNDF